MSVFRLPGSTKRRRRRHLTAHSLAQVTQYKAGKASLYAQGKRRYDAKQKGFGGQTKPVFHKKVTVATTAVRCRWFCSHARYRCLFFFSRFVGQDDEEDRAAFGMCQVQPSSPAGH